MKLDMQLFRDILLYLESLQYLIENSDGYVEGESIDIRVLYEKFSQHEKTVIFYTLKNLHEANYISLSTRYANNMVVECCINYITFAGHEFIASVKDEAHWKGILKALPIIRDYSLAAINAISKGITTAAISAYLGNGR